MWVEKIWPFSVFHRIERKIDIMTTKGEQMKAVLDSLAGHFSGLKSGIESLQANLAAAIEAGKDPLLDAALAEANDLNEKAGAMEAALKPVVDIPQTANPNPPVDPNAPAPVTDPAPVTPPVETPPTT